MNLLQQLDIYYPGWQQLHDNAIDAAIECGLIDEDVLPALEVPELDFRDNPND